MKSQHTHNKKIRNARTLLGESSVEGEEMRPQEGSRLGPRFEPGTCDGRREKQEEGRLNRRTVVGPEN